MKRPILHLFLAFVLVFASVSLFSISVYLVYLNMNSQLNYYYLGFSIFSTISMFFILSGVWYVLNAPTKSKPIPNLRDYPIVAIVVPCYNEPVKVIQRTFDSLKKIDYPKNKMNFYLLDDSSKNEISKGLKKMCRIKGYTYIQRENKKDYKGGNVNNFLFNHCKEKYMALFDADEELIDPSFLKCCMSQFNNDKIAYVQTLKYSRKGNIFENAMSETNAIMFNLFQPVNSKKGLSLFCGSSAVLRTDILKKLGGFPKSIIEDVAYSLRANINRYKGRYINWNFIFGEKIDSFSAFKRQHFRYNKGNTRQIFAFYLPNILKIPARLHPLYFVQFTGLHYLSIAQLVMSLAVLVMLIMLPHSFVLLAAILIFLLVPFLACIILSKIYAGSFTLGILAYLLNFSISIARLCAAIEGALGLKSVWVPTANIKQNKYSIKWSIANSLIESVFAIALIIAGITLMPLSIASTVLLIWAAGIYFTTFIFSFLLG